MSAQHHEVLERADAADAVAAAAPAHTATAARRAAASPSAITTVASGDGFHGILRSLGADSVVSGGQTMNPSIEDLLNGVRAANAERVILLPNNANVILTAEQVDQLADGCEVRVVPTRNLPQGISALLAFDPSATIDENYRHMLAAIAAVRAVEITHAVRASSVNGHKIKTGDVIAVVDDEITEVGNDYLEVIEAVLGAQETDAGAGHRVSRSRGQRRGRGGTRRRVAHRARRRRSSSCTPEARSTTHTCSPSSDVIHLVTDSTSDILPSEARTLGVNVVPLTVRFGEEQFRDGVDIDADAFYAKLENTNIHPKTSQPSPEAFAALYRTLLVNPDDRWSGCTSRRS